ncbi:MAG: hypothetical protein M3071_21910 [Actinomycetota bacterium]|nr:hypothetical protein [Actinomycetota bacterium]
MASLATPPVATLEGAPQSTLLSAGDHPTEKRLAGNAVGLPGVLFMIVTGAAPITAMLFNVPVAIQGGGSAAPAAFLVATVALTIFSVGYVAMARRVTASGGFYSFISHGLGQTAAAAPVCSSGCVTSSSCPRYLGCAGISVTPPCWNSSRSTSRLG